jgi:hypothetical protein
VARSLRKPNANTRWGRPRESFQGGEARDALRDLYIPIYSPEACASPPGRSIVFMAGGVTFSEMRCAYEVMSATQREIVIGGTSYLKPNAFVEQLKDIR